jgi:hypothetical protein
MARKIPRQMLFWAQLAEGWMDQISRTDYMFLRAKWDAAIAMAGHDPEPLRRFLNGFLPIPREARGSLAVLLHRAGTTAAGIGAIGGRGKRSAEKTYARERALVFIESVAEPPSRAVVVRAIRVDVLRYAKSRGSPMSSAQAERTIDGWLKSWPEGRQLFAVRAPR